MRRDPSELTVMQIAFLEALFRFVARETGGLVALPIGRVDRDELRQVIIAQLAARRAPNTNSRTGLAEPVRDNCPAPDNDAAAREFNRRP